MSRFRYIHNLSIKNKIILIILLVTFLILGLGFVFIASWNINRIKTEIKSNLVLNAKLVGNYCVVPLAFEDDYQATEALSHLKTIEFIESAYLFNKKGEIFAAYPDSLMRDTTIKSASQISKTSDNGHFYVQESIQFIGETYGTIYIKANNTPLYTYIQNLVLMLSILAIVLVFLSILLAGTMQNYISKPIIILKNHFDKIAKHQDFTKRIKKRNNDEVGHLFDGFNNLINQIQIHSVERNLVEKQLRESQEKLDLALKGGEIGIWEWDLKTNVTLWDSKMENMFGLQEGAFKQTYDAFKACLHPDDIKLTEKAIKDAFDEIAPYDIIYRVVWENKSIKYIRAKALISKNELQKPIKMIGVCFDVTEIKEAESELKKHREKLEDIVKVRTQKLEEKNNELESFNQLFIDREFRIKELRDEIANLKSAKEK